MNKEELISLLSEWNFWKKEQETGIERSEYMNKSLMFLKTKANKILAITGVRRSGKSFLTKQIIKEFIKEGIEPKNTLIVNFEEVKIDEELNLKLLIKIYEAFKEIINPDKQPIIVLDEVQEIPKWEKFVRTLQEKNEAKIIVTGSSSKIMSDELATILTGRVLEIGIFPLNFKEFLKFKSFEFKGYKDLIIRKNDLKKLLREYLKFGGFPEVIIEEQEYVKISILKKYYNDIIIKDIVRRYKIRNIKKIEILSNYYLTNFSSSITFNRISKFLKLPVKTVEIYSKYIESSKLLFFVSRFSFSVKEQENSPRKVYPIDTGLVNAISFRLMENKGKLMENLVAIELYRERAKKSLTEIYYWKDSFGREVDFVVKEGLKVKQLIQVCWDISNEETKKRELKSLLKASKELKCRNLLVITEDYEHEEIIEKRKIIYKPLWKWLLAEIFI